MSSKFQETGFIDMKQSLKTKQKRPSTIFMGEEMCGGIFGVGKCCSNDNLLQLGKKNIVHYYRRNKIKILLELNNVVFN